jgi:hypothetical protein
MFYERPRMRIHLKVAAVILAVSFAGSVLITHVQAADAKKPQYTTKDIMKAVHKGDDNIGKRVSKGVASKDDIDTMVKYYESLPLNDPPRGDKAEWNAKTKKLVAAAREVKTGAPGALDHYKEAANCKACHTAHKPEDKK